MLLGSHKPHLIINGCTVNELQQTFSANSLFMQLDITARNLPKQSSIKSCHFIKVGTSGLQGDGGSPTTFSGILEVSHCGPKSRELLVVQNACLNSALIISFSAILIRSLASSGGLVCRSLRLLG